LKCRTSAGPTETSDQAGLGLTTDVIIAAMMLLAGSAAWAQFDMTAITMRQRQVPAELLGRITSLNGTVQGGGLALGALAGGAVARRRRDTRPDADRCLAHHCDSKPAHVAA
jgi:MYXO-CTERM domain-containing protein